MPKSRSYSIIKRPDRDGLYLRLWVDNEDGTKTRINRRIENRSEGKRLAEQITREVQQHGAKIIESDRMKFSQLAQHYEQTKLIPPKYQGEAKIAGLRSYKTQARRLKTLVEYFGHRLIKSITHGDVERFKLKRLELPTWRGDERSHADVNRDLALLRIVFNYAKKQGWVAKNPFERGEALITSAHETKRDRVLGREEELRLLLACEKPARQHLRPILILLLDTAMRKGEALSLNWSDVDLDSGIIRLRATITKTAKPRVVPITSRLRIELEKLRVFEAGKPDARIFKYGDFKRAYAAACEEAGIAGVRIHDLRHTAITRMIESGMPHAQVMVVSGHSEFSTFRRYVSTDGDAVRRAGEALDAWHAMPTVATQSEYVN